MSAYAILTGGFIAGVLDLTYAILVYSPRNPILIPQTIASGILGQQSYSGGTATAVLGIVLHFFIALSAAAIYYVASRKLTVLVQHPVVSGLFYGACVYLVMHLIVLPLSAVPHGHMPFIYKVYEFFEHCVFVGLSISLSVRYFSRDLMPSTAPAQ